MNYHFTPSLDADIHVTNTQKHCVWVDEMLTVDATLGQSSVHSISCITDYVYLLGLENFFL